MLAPLATVVLVLVTLFGALPVYSHVADCSPNGMGSIAMLERLVHGWTGKAMVLALLGFAATDFVITKTLSAADAAVHLLDNPLWELRAGLHSRLDRRPAADRLTMILLVLLGATFLRGFKEAIGLAAVIVGWLPGFESARRRQRAGYLAIRNPEFLEQWMANLVDGNWHLERSPARRPRPGGRCSLLSLLLFPKLALGLSGFETGVAVMPLIHGDAQDHTERPLMRIRNTRKLLVAAALIMSVYRCWPRRW